MNFYDVGQTAAVNFFALEKTSARAIMRQIKHRLGAGDVEGASRLATTAGTLQKYTRDPGATSERSFMPGAPKTNAPGRSIFLRPIGGESPGARTRIDRTQSPEAVALQKHRSTFWGGGAEASPVLAAHPQYGINVTKAYHPNGFLRPLGVSQKARMLETAFRDHPHVAQLLGATHTDGMPYPLHHMEYVPGDTAWALEQQGKLTPERSMAWGNARASVRNAAERSNYLLHDDDNPGNWILDRQGVWKLVDFVPGGHTNGQIPPETLVRGRLPGVLPRTAWKTQIGEHIDAAENAPERPARQGSGTPRPQALQRR